MHIELLGESILGAGLQGYGTNLVLDMVNNCGGLPTRNRLVIIADEVLDLLPHRIFTEVPLRKSSGKILTGGKSELNRNCGNGQVCFPDYVLIHVAQKGE